MADSLLTNLLKTKISAAIEKEDFEAVICILDSLKTSYAGTAKMRDKKFTALEIYKYIRHKTEGKSADTAKHFYNAGRKILGIKSDNAKEVGIQIISHGFRYNKEVVTDWLYKISGDSNWEVREYVAGTIINVLVSNPGFYKTLIKWSKDKSVNIRRAVVMSALGLKDKSKTGNIQKAFDLIEPLLYDSAVYIKKNLGPFILGSHIGNSFPEVTFKQIDKWIRIKDEHVRWNIAMAFNCSFGNKYPERALKYLEILSKDKSKVVSRAVTSTLRSLNKRHPELIGKFSRKNSINL